MKKRKYKVFCFNGEEDKCIKGRLTLEEAQSFITNQLEQPPPTDKNYNWVRVNKNRLHLLYKNIVIEILYIQL